jgi:hypothetical protein
MQRQELPLVSFWTARDVVGMKRALQGFRQIFNGPIRLRGGRMTAH